MKQTKLLKGTGTAKKKTTTKRRTTTMAKRKTTRKAGRRKTRRSAAPARRYGRISAYSVGGIALIYLTYQLFKNWK